MGNVTLVIASVVDVASHNTATQLLSTVKWNVGPKVEGYPSWHVSSDFEGCTTHLWLRKERPLWDNDLDKKWAKATGEKPDDVLFISRSTTGRKEGMVAVTPIGNPSPNKKPKEGGIAGLIPPPNPRMKAIFNALIEQSTNLKGRIYETEFQMTHHGPWLETPATYIESGPESQWDNQEMAKAVALSLCDVLGLASNNPKGIWNPIENNGELVIVTLAGLHYCPRMARFASQTDAWVGHILPKHALRPLFTQHERREGNVATPNGLWEVALDAVIESTKKAYPNGEVIAVMDWKGLLGVERRGVLQRLAEQGIRYVKSLKDFQRIGPRLWEP